MILTSDIDLRLPLWERADNELCDKNGLGIFRRLVDVYVLACAIGIKEDKVILDSEIKNPLTSKSIGRNTHRENLDIRDMLDSMLQNILLNSDRLTLNDDERIKLAFDSTYVNKKIRAVELLNGYANYGLTRIFDVLSSNASLVAEDDLYKYFESLSNAQYDKLIETITLDDLKN